MVDGKLVLDDPDALAVVQAVDRHNRNQAKAQCAKTLALNAQRVPHFVVRVAEKQLNIAEVVIVLINVDDVHGGPLADLLMPGHDWQSIRDQDQVPFARGLALRKGIQEALHLIDEEAALALQGMKNLPVVVIDYGVAQVYDASLVEA